MRNLTFLSLLILWSLAACEQKTEVQTSVDSILNDSIPETNSADPCLQFKDTSVLEILKATGLCICGSSSEVALEIERDTGYTIYGACDPFYVKLFRLQKNEREDPLYLVTIKGPLHFVGTGGPHNYVVKEVKGQFQRVNFFQGYVDSIQRKDPYADIIFKTFEVLSFPEPHRQNYTLLLSWDGASYSFKKMISVSDYYMDKDSTVIVTKYDPQFDTPKYWEYLSETP